MDYLAFAIVMLLAQFSPGPDMLLLLKNAVNHPLRAGLWTVAGVAVGLCFHTTLALTGLAVIFSHPGPAVRLLNLCGGLYLGWLAFQLLRSALRTPPPDDPDAPPGREKPISDTAAFLQGLITNLLNPKAALFLLTVVAAMMGPDSGTARKLGFGAIIIGQALVFWSLFVFLLKLPGVRGLYLSGERILNCLFGIGLAFLAVTSLAKAW